MKNLPELRTIHGQPSWTFSCDSVQAALTRAGGHLAPVSFRLGKRRLQPYSIAPWAEEKIAPANPQIIRSLRGDFFGLPFGGNEDPYHHEKHPVHGETANNAWVPVGYSKKFGVTEFTLETKTRVRKGLVRKTLRLRDGETAVYQTHTISGMEGPMPAGHHAMLRFPDEGGIISTSPIAFGMVLPKPFEQPELGGYQALKPGATFASLDRVPLLTGGFADLTRYPARRGYEDLVILPARSNVELGWTAVSFPHERAVFFSLRNTALLASTMLWISNGGRHYAPWSSRHVNVLGLEDLTSCFHLGLAPSAARNVLSKMGIPTALSLEADCPTVVPYIMGMVETPAGFGAVKRITRTASGIRIHPASGKPVEAKLDTGFLFKGA
ncbi:MAG: hypothetical protein J0L75_19135 [Spirochaetes bacterium]|nr:hypothetical protein [Spirochaetota bacterium]